MNTTTQTVTKMSKTMIECELRAAWAQVECDVRHGLQPSKRDADYIAALTRELDSRD